MNEGHLGSIILGLIAGFYTTIFLLCLSDVIYLNGEIIQMKIDWTDIRSFSSDHRTTRHSRTSTNLTGQICLSYSEQRHILNSINNLSNLALLVSGIYSLSIYGLGTYHGLVYRLIFFLVKISIILLSMYLDISFDQSLSSDFFLYIWIDVNCLASIYRTLRQRFT